MNLSLRKARTKVAKARAAVAKDDEVLRAIQQEIDGLNAKVAALRKRQADKRLHEALAEAERELAEAEEVAVIELNIALAGEIVRRQARDPVRHQEWIIEHVMQLRASVRSELDTAITEKYRVPPLITQALALLPPLDDMDKPVADLGYFAAGTGDWPSRRRAILAAAESAA